MFGEEFISKQPKPAKDSPNPPPLPPDPPLPKPVPEITGIFPTIKKGEVSFVLTKDGKHTRVSFTEYREYVRTLILERLPTVEAFVQEWVDNPNELLAISELQNVLKHKQDNYDSFDVIAELAYQVEAKTKPQRVEDFLNQSEAWLVAMPKQSANTLRALGDEFKKEGTEGLNNKELFNVQSIKNASGGNVANALRLVGKPVDVFKEFKTRIFRINT